MTDIQWILLLAVAISNGTPLVFAALGTLLAERVGVINLAVEGILLMGVACAFVAFGATQSVIGAFLVSGFVGFLSAALLAAVVIPFRANQIVTGLALTIFFTGLAVYISKALAEGVSIPLISPLPIPLLADIPIVGPIMFAQNVLVYLSWLLALAMSFLFFHTRFGQLAISLGENPRAASSLGVNVNAVRFAYVAIGGALIGFGGGYVAVAILGFWANTASTAGAGWIAIALVIFASWRPLRVLFGAYFFGLVLQANFSIQATGNLSVPAEVLKMLPYLGTIVLLTILTALRRKRVGLAPEALGSPFVPGDR